MKKIFLIVILLLFFSFKSFAATDGKGQIQLSENVVNSFINYITGNTSGSSKSLLNQPGTFWITIDGSDSFWWYNPWGSDGVNNSSAERAKCEAYYGESCSRFARGRYVRWDNGINPKGKAAKFSSKLSESEVRAKLTKLGFYNNGYSNITNTPKITKEFKKDVVYFNKCSWSLNEDEYYWSFEVNLNKGSHVKDIFFAKGEKYSDKHKIILNNENLIRTKINEYSTDTYVQYEFDKKNDEITKFVYNDKKGKNLDDTSVLICNDIVGTLNNLQIETKKKKKETKKVVKKYSESGERSIALSWDGYEDLIAGTVEFNEADYKGALNLPLPNNDGTCDGTYSLQEGGKGTWQIACTNNMGAAGTLKWTKNGGVTGSGRDHNDKKVKFTVSKKT